MNLDIKGTPIEVGSKVVFGMSQSMNLLEGVVLKISPKTVEIAHHYIGYHYSDRAQEHPLAHSTNYRRAFDNVVVI